MRNRFASTIESGIWRYIRLFSSPDSLHKKIDDRKRVREIIFCTKQAEEYYEASKHTTTLTKPVPLYYGMLNLSKALILLRKRTTLDGITSHGLSRSQKRSRKHLLSLSCRVHQSSKSVFSNLLDVAKQDRLEISYSSDGVGNIDERGISYPNDLSAVSGQNFSMRELLTLVPELGDIVVETGRLKPRLVPISYHYFEEKSTQKNLPRIITGHMEIRHRRCDALRNLVMRFEERSEMAGWRMVKEVLDIFQFEIPRPMGELPGPPMRETMFGEKYGVLSSSKKLALSEIIIHYLLMFILSDAARYVPNVWHQMMQSESTDRQLIEAYLEVSEVKYPLLMLREFYEELIYFNRTDMPT